MFNGESYQSNTEYRSCAMWAIIAMILEMNSLIVSSSLSYWGGR